MTEPVLIAMIAAIVSMVGSIAAAIVTILTHGKVAEVEKNTNSMKDALVASTKSDALQTGRAEGKADERAKQADIRREVADSKASTPTPVKIIAAEPVPVTETSTKGKP